jgi:UDP-N-acetylglucosamine/UDP-N-acetylgalactosamine diphosphorylase
MPSLDSMFKTGILYLAGGQGTRLGYDGPKGCVIIPLKEEKTLFQIHLEKIKDPEAPIAIMTSPLNHEATLAYLKKENNFGLKNVTLFKQGMENGLPDGNGKALTYFCDRGVWDKWDAQGVKKVQVIPIDNPLAVPFDEELVKGKEELILRAVKRTSSEEKLGVIYAGDRLEIKEYSEVHEVDGNLLGNTGLFSCTMEFVKRAGSLSLSPHIVQKKVDGRWVSKKEYFIFDLFPYAKSFKIILSDRKKCFAPLKNASGPDSLETVMKALMT